MRETPSGGCELRVAIIHRGCVVFGSALIAIGWVGSVVIALVAHRAPPFGVTLVPAIVLALATTAFAVWCARADEVWCLARDRLEHRVGIGSLRIVRSYRNGEVGVLLWQNRWGGWFGRVYVSDVKGRHYLFERRPDEASALADFLCSVTGWPRRDWPVGSGF